MISYQDSQQERTVTRNEIRQLVTSIVNNINLSSKRNTVIKMIWEAVVQRARFILEASGDQG